MSQDSNALPSRRQMLTGSLAAAGAMVTTGAPVAALAEAPASVKKWDQEYDVIVVGFGVAGGSAAAEAVRAGAKVLVLDRASAAANESHGTTYYLGGGTGLQKKLGIEDTPDNMFRFLQALYGKSTSEEKIRLYCEKSVEHYEWLVKAGVPFTGELHPDSWPEHGASDGLFFSGEENSYPFREIAKPCQRGHSVADWTGGPILQKKLLDETKAKGVTQLLAADAKQLAIGADGSVEGVLAEIDGKVRAFRARRGVILATGGFANNRDMVANNAPDFALCDPIDVGANDGWGHRAGKSVGGQLRHMDAGVAYFPMYPPLSRKDAILVNKLGQRFIHEDAYYGVLGSAVVRQQKGLAYLICDTQAAGEIQGKGLLGPGGDIVQAKGNTIAELEKALGIPEPGLQQTMDTYNRYAAKGEDPFFRKNKRHVRVLKGPYVALLAEAGKSYTPFFTLGGLATNAKSEVLNDDGNVIHGLYACGRVASGITAQYYFSTGLSLGECSFFGRIAGVSAAANKTA